MSTRLFILTAAVCLVGLATASLGCAQDADSVRQRADTYLNTGRYDDARSLYRRLLESTPDDAAALGYARTFAAVGDYEAGLAAVDALLEDAPGGPLLLQAKGRLLADVGRYDEAREAFRAALEQKEDLWSCTLDLADLMARTGRDQDAWSLYAAVYEQFQRGVFRTAPDLMVAGRAAAALARFRDANDAFRTAFRVDPAYVPNLYAWAELFRRKYNQADARRTYEDALGVNPRHGASLVGLGRSTNSFERQEELAQQALAINPKMLEALDLLASLRILDGQYAEAETLVQRALDVNPNAVSSLAQLASIHYLRGDTVRYRAAEQRALAVDAQASDFYLAVAENANYRFRYPAAAAFAEQAVQADPSDIQARAELGTALLRLGRREEARSHLERAFEHDPYNLFASNTLTLLDGYGQFALLESPNVRLLIHDDERDVLGPLILEMAEAAFDSLRRRYPYEPHGKILIEAYNNADDFAVRVSGIPHRGLLGVSFGDVVAINTPVAQTGQAYNWARTLWHEIAHTMAIGVSQHHVPRWLTEGLSVYEEKRGRPEWGRDMELAFLMAFDSGRLLPLEEIDRGFTRPAYPGQVLLSYYHAGEVIAFIADAYGFDAVIDILEHLGSGNSDEEAVRAATGVGLADLDRQFRETLRRRYREAEPVLEGLPDLLSAERADVTSASADTARGPFFAHLQTGTERLAREDYQAAESAFKAALSLYPSYVGPMNPYEGLAAVYRARGAEEALVDVLVRHLSLSEHETSAALELAGIYTERGDAAAAAAMLERTLHVAPYDVTVRTRLAEAYERAGSHDDAILHRRAVLALEPSDRAGAYYQLARSLYGNRQFAEAKRAVLQSLEIAPGFRQAQKLLLEVAP